MPPRPSRNPDDKPATLSVVPLSQAAETAVGRKPGRPRKSEMPPMPALQVTPLEKQMYDYFISAYLEEYPDLTPSDKILLQLAAIEYIKYHRVAAQELESGQVISMARQHPYTQMRGLLDSMAVTRKQRKRDGSDDTTASETQAKLRELFG